MQMLHEMNHISSENFKLHQKKNSVDSVHARTSGNNLYAKKDFEGAIVKYNCSICLADDSETLSLAYANRAQCFFKMNRLDLSLADIKLARESGYPVNKLSKLDTREQECVHKMNARKLSEPVSTDQVQNDFHSVDAVRFERDNVYGRMVTAKRNIDIGETVLMEEMYIRSTFGFNFDCCSHCGEKNMNFIPCNCCSGAMYCSKVCAEKSFHEYECDTVFGTSNDIDELIFTFRSIVLAINAFATINELITIVESSSSNQVESKYGTFFHLSTGIISNTRVVECLETVYFVFHGIMCSSKLKEKFSTVAAQRFLQHLILHHYFVLCTNSFGFQNNGLHVRQISLQASLLNHSCLPNIAKLSRGNISLCKAIRPIKQGEQLFLTYLDDNVFGMSEKDRNNQLYTTYGFRCRCLLCKNGPLRADHLEKDENFIFVAANAMIAEEKKDVVLLRNVIEHCVQFLIQHYRMIGSQEMYYIADTLGALFSKEINGF